MNSGTQQLGPISAGKADLAGDVFADAPALAEPALPGYRRAGASASQLPATGRVFVSCAEISGDQHAAGFVRALRRLMPAVEVDALGGPALAAAGATIWHETTQRAALGLHIIFRAAEVWRMLREVRARWQREGPPDLVVCCDSWSMNRHVLRLAREQGVATLYYITPQVWANRPGRMQRMRRLIDEAACILPFEEPWLRERGVEARFVGHPLFDELPEYVPPAGPRFPDRPPVIALAAGSRRQVAWTNFPAMLRVAIRVREEFPEARFVSPTTDVTHQIIEQTVRRAGASDWIELHRNAFDEVIPGCDFAITASGTAVLHIAAHRVPMVAVFAASRLAWHAVGRWLIDTRTYTLVNLLHPERRHVIPEFIPWFGPAGPVAEMVIDYLRHPEKMAEQTRQVAEVIDPLRQRGAGEMTARMAIELLNRK